MLNINSEVISTKSNTSTFTDLDITILTAIFSELYPDKRDIARILSDAQIEVNMIPQDSTVWFYWMKVCRYTAGFGVLDILLRAVLDESRENQHFSTITSFYDKYLNANKKISSDTPLLIESFKNENIISGREDQSFIEKLVEGEDR